MFANYDSSKYNPQARETPPPGRYTARIEDAVSGVSKSSGAAMITVTFSLGEEYGRVWHYFVDNEYAQKNLDQFFSCFGLSPGNFDLAGWIGRDGELEIKHEEYNGRVSAKVRYFVLKDNQGAAGARRDAPASAERSAPPAFEKDFPLDLDFDSLPAGNPADESGAEAFIPF